MALPWLKTLLGDVYTEELEKQIADKIGEGFVSKADFNGRSDELKAIKEQLTQRDADLEALRKGAGDNDALKLQLSELQAEHKKAAEEAANILAQKQLDHSLEMALLSAGAKSTKAAKALLDLEKIKLDGEQVLGLSDQLETLKKEQGFLFADTQADQGQEQNSNSFNYQPRGGQASTNEPSSLRDAVAQTIQAQRAKK